MQFEGGWVWPGNKLFFIFVFIIAIISIYLGYPVLLSIILTFLKMLIPVLGFAAISPVGLIPPPNNLTKFFIWLNPKYGVSIKFNLLFLFLAFLVSVLVIILEKIVN